MRLRPLSLALATCLAGTTLTACSRSEPAQPAAPEPVNTASVATPGNNDVTADFQGVHRFRIGTLQAMALQDGTITVANDGKTFGVGRPADDVTGLLRAAGQPTDALHLGIQPLLVRSGAQVLLFDTGAADASFAKGGHLPAALRAAGLAPADVTDIFISHKHPDHVGGLLGEDGAAAFPNATVHLSAPEWDALQADAASAALVAAISPKVKAFTPGAELVPGVVKAVEDAGHTSGHSAYEINGGADRLLYIGDAAHHFVVSVQQPEWTVAFDEDAAVAERRRRELLQRAADEHLRVYAVHFPFPGLGRVQAKGEAFTWVPED